MDNQDKEIIIKVKDLIEYLSRIDPEIIVELDRNGWDNNRTIVSNIGSVFQLYKDILFIEN